MYKDLDNQWYDNMGIFHVYLILYDYIKDHD